MATITIPIIGRYDRKTNWETNNPILKLGEIAYVLPDSGPLDQPPLEARWGINDNFEDCPILFTTFKPIKVTGGRNLDEPTKRNQNHEYDNENEAFEAIFNPYQSPSYNITPGSPLAILEVGDIYNTTVNFKLNISNGDNILKESGIKRYYEEGGAASGVALSQQTSNSFSETITKTLSITSPTSGDINAIRVRLKDSRSANFLSYARAFVRFNYRSGYFLWSADEDLTDSSIITSSRIMDIINNIQNVDNVSETTIDKNGENNFGTVKFLPGKLSNDKYNVYVFNPASKSTALIAQDANRSSPVDTTTRTFEYVNEGISTSYTLTKMNDFIAAGEFLAWLS